MDYKYRLGVDVDGVLRDIVTPIMKIFKIEYPESVRSNVVKSYDFLNVELSKEIKDYLMFQAYPEDVFLNSKPFPEAVEDFKVFSEWAKENKIKLICATYQKPDLIGMTYYWLAKYGFLFEELHIEKEKQKLPIDFLIDDAPCNYEEWSRAKNKETFFLFDRSYNKMVETNNRVYKLTDVIEKFKSIV